MGNLCLNQLESEAIYILREVYAQFKNPMLLFSGGKDSTVLLHLARKAFFPGEMPFPLLHIDTGHNFKEALDFRDRKASEYNLNVHVWPVVDTLRKKSLEDATGKFPSRNALQSHALLDAIQTLGIDACIGGARRDEEKARAKERIFSFRDATGAWQPYSQRPEPWNLFNGRIKEGENIRVFPISNWSEIDVWRYIQQEQIELPSIYFSHERDCILHQGKWLSVSEHIRIDQGDVMERKQVRYRTVGDMTCTAAIESTAVSLEEVIHEIENSLISERGETRMDDQMSEAAMEDRKLKGYF